MDERCAGVDVPKKPGVAGVLTVAGQASRTFGTITVALRLLANGLLAWGYTPGASESTGDAWTPVFNILEGTCAGGWGKA
jgi:hypothetical protein